MQHTGAYGDRLQIKAAQGELHGEQRLTIEIERGTIGVFTPAEARLIAADLIKAADDTDAAAQEAASPDGECHNHECGLVSSRLVHVDH
ncbi:hypothetical protein GA0115233_103014 [Streptomyces sp. DI166]|uniref:hypothetical protein n=1 Tax=Streptomyces sp. DI166 TaxID=1839783 RepID=UPI0007F471D7|nr:hypothetical protein [Streptomyces sp. DI166]SBT91382.1 hypothetical protein GA0115233_103014 [Streptomyces sp. DI166]